MKLCSNLHRISRIVSIILLITVLGGCASSRILDTEVHSFTGAQTAITPASYEFERLPSQQDNPLQNQLEALAEPVLQQIGLSRHDTEAPYSVTMAVRVEASPRHPYQPSRQIGMMGSEPGLPWHAGLNLSMEPPWYRHTVHILLRDRITAQPVFESTASHEGPWPDTIPLFTPLLQAALHHFPVAGKSMVRIEWPVPTRK
jgi:hypothetical protein